MDEKADARSRYSGDETGNELTRRWCTRGCIHLI